MRFGRELHRICHTHIKHEEEGKFRCKECTKLFSALKFIEKHLSTKHPETLGDTLDQVRPSSLFHQNLRANPPSRSSSSSTTLSSTPATSPSPPPPQKDRATTVLPLPASTRTAPTLLHSRTAVLAENFLAENSLGEEMQGGIVGR